MKNVEKSFATCVRRHVLFVVQKSVLMNIVLNPYAQGAINAVGVWNSGNVKLIIVTACSVRNVQRHHVLIVIVLAAAKIALPSWYVRARDVIPITATSAPEKNDCDRCLDIRVGEIMDFNFLNCYDCDTCFCPSCLPAEYHDIDTACAVCCTIIWQLARPDLARQDEEIKRLRKENEELRNQARG